VSHFFETEGYSIYVRNLPQNATATQLHEVFKTFGPIKQGGVQVRSNKVAFSVVLLFLLNIPRIIPAFASLMKCVYVSFLQAARILLWFR